MNCSELSDLESESLGWRATGRLIASPLLFEAVLLRGMPQLSVGQVLPGWDDDDDDEDDGVGSDNVDLDVTDLSLHARDSDGEGAVAVVEFDHPAEAPSELSVRAGDLLYAVVPCEFEQHHGRQAFVEVTMQHFVCASFCFACSALSCCMT